MTGKAFASINTKRGAALWLTCAYALSAALRFALAAVTSAYPMVLIDEPLYYSMARAIATQGEMLYLGQLANYSYVLYPLVLSPVYALFGEGAPFYRLLQLWNILLMTLSLFPAYALAKAICKDARKALLAALLVALLPDMLLGQTVMSESVIYPLVYALMLCVWRYLEKPGWRYALLMGLLGGLLYSAKPGQAVPAAVALLAALLLALRGGRKSEALQALSGLLAAAATAALLYLLGRYAFGMRASVLSVYGDQVNSQMGLQLRAFLRGAALSPYYLLLGGAILPLLLPLYNRRAYDHTQKRFLLIVYASLLVLMLGTAWVVNRVEIDNPTIHTRYIAMYIPVLALFCLLPECAAQKQADDAPGGKALRSPADSRARIAPVFALLAYMLLCTVYPGCQSGVAQNTSAAFNLVVSALVPGTATAALRAVSGMLIALAIGGAAWAFLRWGTERLKKAALCALAALCLLNNITAYSRMASRVNDGLIADNKEAAALLDGREYLYVYATNRAMYNAYMDSNSRDNTSMVFINDLFNHTVKNEGAYLPFTPDISRGMIPDRPTPDTRLMLFDKQAYGQVELASGARLLRSTANGCLYAVSIPEGERWADSMLGGVIGEQLQQGTEAFLYLFGDKAASVLDISMDIELPTATKWIIRFEGGAFSFDLPAGRDTYTIKLNAPARYVGFSFDSCDARVYGYSTK